MRHMLQQLYDVQQLDQLPVIRSLGQSGVFIQERICQLLTDEQPPPPLTQLEQEILKETYLQRGWNKNQLADRFHMSRTTFYRHSRIAVRHLAYALERLLSPAKPDTRRDGQ